ncbi:MAG: 50S ribosomal protein L22 [Bacilli bacterium]|nr:50S ribosomal protein L22 [Bacilli bacterium]
MEVKAIAKGIRISGDKARLTVNLIRGKDVSLASDILRNLNNKASKIVEKVLNSAIANAENNNKLDKSKLYIKKIYVGEGPVIKRVMMDSRGHVGRKDHQTCHITVIVDERS